LTASAGSDRAILLLTDEFAADSARGCVLGPAGPDAPRRGGRDAERILSIDGGALRIQPPLRPGWGNTCLSYGPFPARPGLALSVAVLNGHNTSQSENMSDSLRTRLDRWARGCGAVPIRRRLVKWLGSGRVGRTWRQLRWWRILASGAAPVPRLDENLAIGFYPSEVCNPLAEGTGFVMHATGAENGELWVGGSARFSPVVRGVQNVPVTYVVILREDDAVYYAASLPGAHGLGAYPELRPLAIGPRPAAAEVHVAVHQALLGQIGFRADTRVYGVRVAQLDPDDGPGVGLALPGGPLAALAAGDAVAMTDGARIMIPGQPAGLIQVRLDPAQVGGEPVIVVWRAAPGGGRWELRLSAHALELGWRDADGWHQVAAADGRAAAPADVQIQDDGNLIAVLADGMLAFGQRFRDDALGGQVGFGCVQGAGVGLPDAIRRLEAHPRRVRLPGILEAGAPWLATGHRVVVADDFQGTPADLEGRLTPTGGRTWQRLAGTGRLELTGDAAVRWRASAAAPLPGRTIYAIDWQDAGLVDLSVELTPPGTSRGQKEHGTAGFCLWQDADNHILINTWLDDCYGGASLSSFFNIGGFEDLYDAIWTNVADRVTWGRPFRLRLISDGLRYCVYIGDEPVLYRSLADVYPGCRPLRITKVGLLGNWEWGADTGSRFARFEARS
jgi:hypothetical protein